MKKEVKRIKRLKQTIKKLEEMATSGTNLDQRKVLRCLEQARFRLMELEGKL